MADKPVKKRIVYIREPHSDGSLKAVSWLKEHLERAGYEFTDLPNLQHNRPQSWDRQNTRDFLQRTGADVVIFAGSIDCSGFARCFPSQEGRPGIILLATEREEIKKHRTLE